MIKSYLQSLWHCQLFLFTSFMLNSIQVADFIKCIERAYRFFKENIKRERNFMILHFLINKIEYDSSQNKLYFFVKP